MDEVEGCFVFPSRGEEMNAAGVAFHVYAEERARRGEELVIPDGLRAKGYAVERHDNVETVVARETRRPGAPSRTS